MPQPVGGHIPHTHPGDNGMPVLEISSWDYDDGSVGAMFDNLPDGVLWAKNDAALMEGVTWLFQQVGATERVRMATNATQVQFDLGMRATTIEGKFHVRFDKKPDFGLEFDSPEKMSEWMKEIIEMGLAINTAAGSTKLQA